MNLLKIIIILLTIPLYAQTATGGMLVKIHEIDSAQMSTFSGLTRGSLVFNTEDKFLYAYDGNYWVRQKSNGTETNLEAAGLSPLLTITGKGTESSPYIISGTKTTLTEDGNDFYTFSNGVETKRFRTTVIKDIEIISTNSDVNHSMYQNLNVQLVITGHNFDKDTEVIIPGQTITEVVLVSTNKIIVNLLTSSYTDSNHNGTVGVFDVTVNNLNSSGPSTLVGGLYLNNLVPIASSGLVMETYANRGTSYDGYTLSKSGTINWYGTNAFSQNPEFISTGTGGYLEFIIDQRGDALTVGLDRAPTATTTINQIDFCFKFIQAGSFYIIEDGSNRTFINGGITRGFEAGDVFRIEISNTGEVFYYRNSDLQYISTITANLNLYMNANIQDSGASISRIVLKY